MGMCARPRDERLRQLSKRSDWSMSELTRSLVHSARAAERRMDESCRTRPLQLT
jgi:hypothetical protein